MRSLYMLLDWFGKNKLKENRKMDEEKQTYTFHFVSGETIDIEFSQKKWEELRKSISNNWNAMTITGDYCGINFLLVTHYVKKVEKA